MVMRIMNREEEREGFMMKKMGEGKREGWRAGEGIVTRFRTSHFEFSQIG
jgi:hypothetical protein